MPGTITPRVFISYARSDGEEFARELRERLEEAKIPLWQDRVGMEGGATGGCRSSRPSTRWSSWSSS